VKKEKEEEKGNDILINGRSEKNVIMIEPFDEPQDDERDSVAHTLFRGNQKS